MKKKLLSILVAFIICLSPVLLLTGCGGETDQGVSLTYTSWSVAQGGKFSECTVSGLNITYSKNVYNEETNKYEDVVQDPITDFATAIKNGLGAVGGFDSSKVGTYEMTVMFGGETFKVTYTVNAKGNDPVTHDFEDKTTNGGEEGNTTSDGKCDICDQAEGHSNHSAK